MPRSDKAALRGEAGFENHFSEIYGDRWPALRASLHSPEQMIRRPNAFAGVSDFSTSGAAVRTENGLLDVYVMDAASIAAARALDVRPGDRVLDLCAAPGGKTLVLAEALFSGGSRDGELIANEPSNDRRERLTKVIQQYLPRDVRDHVFVRGLDGVQFGLREEESYDRILVDAPCSGEKHLLENKEELALWGVKRSEGLAMRQYALLAAAWLAVKPGGRIVYSTCSISPEENDGVIGRLIKKKKTPRVVAVEGAEKTEFGAQFFPDRGGAGPIYFAAIEKPLE